MRPIQKSMNLTGIEYYKKHLAIVSCIIPTKLTEKEIEVLACFMSLEKNLIEDEMFNSVTRKKVMKELNLQPGGLGNHIKSMIEKLVLEKHPITNIIRVKTYLFPDETVQGYQIKIVKE